MLSLIAVYILPVTGVKTVSMGKDNRGDSYSMKRFFDITLSLFILLLLWPLFLIVGLIILKESSWPILFIQQRVGQHGLLFPMYKFRSMIIDAAEKGPYFTAQEDDRITPIGHFLRRTSLDELPQIFNVLFGHMSLVGPRPDVLKQKTLYTEEEWDLRCCVRPGLTGWAQVNGRNTSTVNERKRFDIEYVHKIGLLLDIKILWMTARQVILRGSY
jgi:lipopolysaccharide/colanic/teichoic acid biosynthesis glycosyltransferase